jgi:hypothetical protein
MKCYSIIPEPYNDASLRERLTIAMIGVLLWPLSTDEQMTVLGTMLIHQVGRITDTKGEIESIADSLHDSMLVEQQRQRG